MFLILALLTAGWCTALTAENQPSRWSINADQSIRWQADKSALPHYDHIEMAGRKVATVLRYGINEKGGFYLERGMVWPLLRTIPNNTHASLMRRMGEDVTSKILINNSSLKNEKVRSIQLDGIMTVESDFSNGIHLTRELFPSVDKPAFCEYYTIKNTSGRNMRVELPHSLSMISTPEKEGVYGSYSLIVRQTGGTTILEKDQEVNFFVTITGYKKDEIKNDNGFDSRLTKTEAVEDVKQELEKRKELIRAFSDNLVLDTPDDVLNTMFRFAKIRASESIFETKGGFLHGPGGESYYAAIWANDQAEYVNPFFPYLGYPVGNESAMVSYKHFARFMNDDFKPIPSSIIAEGDDIWNGAGDRGDGAMIAYGASRYALTLGDKEKAKELWPLIEWCLEYCHRKLNDAGVVQSDSDELEGRFPAGKANLCTSTLYYDALLSAAYLAEDLGKPAETAQTYRAQAADLRKAIDRYFAAKVEGFDTYQYYDGNDVLRSWICMPLCVGITERKDGTIAALFSPRLWSENGILTQAGSKTFWDRSTLYAMRGILTVGETEKVMDYLEYYSKTRLLGEHVPYPVEAWPEGSQRHLSAESGLYCRIFTEGLFGIRPTGLNSFTLTPRLPKNWDQMSLKHIRAFNTDLDIQVQRMDEKTQKIIVSQYGKEIFSETTDVNATVNIKLSEQDETHSSRSVSVTLNVSSLGALPNDDIDDTEALRKAVHFCKENPNAVLEIPAGVYRLRDEAAVQLEQDAMTSKMGRSTEPVIYTPYYPYAKGLDFNGTKNLTIKAEGATLMCEGWMEPISLDNCENITIEGLTIDYKNKPFSDGIVTAVEANAFEAVFNDERELTEKTPFLRAVFWEKDEDRMWPNPVYFPDIEWVDGKKVRFKSKIDKSLLGAGIGVIHSFHFRPAILILRSSQVTLNDVTIHAQPGMGIVGFLSRDITMNRLSVVPSEGHILSSNTDATHFASCGGTIRFDGCKFQGHQDDATNVHGYYQTIMEVNGEKARLGITHQAFTHAQVADLPDKGDVMELVEADTLKPVATFTVAGTEHTIPNKYWDVTFTEKLPEDAAGKYFLMNISKLPRLEFVNSTVNSHLARAVLVKTRNVLIQNNVFRNSTGTGIHVGAESWWQEGSHAENVIIRDNIITGCGRGTGRQGNASGIAVIIDAKDTEATYLHKNITIENNVIKGDPGLCGIYVGNAQDVVLKHNKILGCKENYHIHSSKVSITD